MDATANEVRQMIDVTDPTERLSMRQVAELCQVHLTTVYEWANAYDGDGRPKLRYLETAKLGGRRYTTRSAIRHFQTQGPPDAQRGGGRPQADERIRRHEANQKVLGRFGIQSPPLPVADVATV